MNKTNELTQSLSQVLPWNKARLDCFSMMILALLSARTICLSRIALLMDSKAKSDSRYQRIKRFFSGFSIDMSQVAKLIFALFSLGNKSFYIAIDRKNWYFGKAKINVFTLGICYEGIAIPLFWRLLPKAGNATGEEHIYSFHFRDAKTSILKWNEYSKRMCVDRGVKKYACNNRYRNY